MSWKMHDREFDAVEALPAPERYDYAIKKIADWKEIWSLGSDDGWVMASDPAGRERFPVWPHERFAQAAASGAWAGCKARAIDLDTFLERWIPGLQADQRELAVFPTVGGQGVPVAPERFSADLEAELDLIE